MRKIVQLASALALFGGSIAGVVLGSPHSVNAAVSPRSPADELKTADDCWADCHNCADKCKKGDQACWDVCYGLNDTCCSLVGKKGNMQMCGCSG